VGKYEVVSECYVPVGSGFRYKRPGQVVTLSDSDAASLAEHVKPVDSSEKPSAPTSDKPKPKRVAKRNTTKPKAEEVELVTENGDILATVTVADKDVVDELVAEEVAGGVTSDASDSQAGDERADAASD
jgi:hypothetical protein